MKRSLTALLAFVMALCASFALCVPAWAQDLTESAYGDITRLVAPSNVDQGQSYSITFGFEIATYGTSFEEGDTYEFDTNLGELFTISGAKTLEVKNEAGELLAVVNGSPDRVIVTIKSGAAGKSIISGEVTTPALTANDVGATVDSPVDKTLVLGDEKADIRFLQRESQAQGGPDEPDYNQLWKLAWANDSHTKASVSMEVNPLGNIDLYRTKNANPTTVTTYKDFYVEDEIPNNGIVDITSMTIYAVVNTVAVAGPDNNKGLEVGDRYAQRSGTNRLLIDRVGNDSDRVRIFMITQTPGETRDEFKARIKSKDLQWGVYTDEENNTQTFMCNFGDLGDPDNNNGIMFNDFLNEGNQAAEKIRANQDLFGPQGPTGGNVVTYFLQFDTYYPDLIEVTKMTNYGKWEAEPTSGPRPQSSGGNNSSAYEIGIGGAEAEAFGGSVSLKLVDEDNRSFPIEGATFKLQRSSSNEPGAAGAYKDTGMTAQTDKNGELSFTSLPQGDYRLVQIDSVDGYVFDNKSYAPNREASADPGAVSETGEFSIWRNTEEPFAVYALATNRLGSYDVSYEFTGSSADGVTELPDEVLELLPQDDKHYSYGDTVQIKQPKKTEVSDADGRTWYFAGYRAEGGFNAADGTIKGDITFIGLWRSYSVYYEFVSGEENRDLPDEVMALLPAAERTHDNGETVKPAELETTEVVVDGEGVWTFEGWEPKEAIIDNANVTFTGAWNFKSHVEAMYSWNWDEVFQEGTELFDINGNELQAPNLPANPTGPLFVGSEVEVDNANTTSSVYYTHDPYGNINGKFTFSGWSAQTIATNPEDVKSVAIENNKLIMPAADVMISGEWSYIVMPQQTYTVHYGYSNAPSGVEDEYPLPIDDNAYVKGQAVTVSDTPEMGTEFGGYTFQGWQPVGDDIAAEDGIFAMPARDVWIVGAWKADDDIPYTVEFYYENEGSYLDEPDDSIKHEGTTGTTVVATEADKTPTRSGYAFDEDAEGNVLEGTVAADGSLVLKVYFKQQFTVTYTDGVEGEEVFADQVTSGIGYGDQTPAFEGGTPSRAGYTFAGWVPEVADTVTADATYVAQWAPIWNPGPGPDDPDPDTPEPDDPEPDNPEPEDPDTPDNPDPDDPDNPNTPDDPDDPDQPDPDQPSDPEDPGEPSDPDQPTGDTPDPDTPASTPGDSNLPQTGDASLLIAGAAASASVTAFAAAAVVRKRK